MVKCFNTVMQLSKNLVKLSQPLLYNLSIPTLHVEWSYSTSFKSQPLVSDYIRLLCYKCYKASPSFPKLFLLLHAFQI